MELKERFTLEKVKEGQTFLFDKPHTWSSFRLVDKVRFKLCRKHQIKKLKVGHAGTLDPLATGLMILCTGKATKKITSLMGLDKEYVAEFTLGKTTPSFDAETEVDAEFPVEHIDEALIQETIAGFIGEQDQVPPLFSAKNINGVRAYELARQGEQKELPPVKIHIAEMELLSWESPKLILRIRCSKGTYIRSIARDFGAKMQSGAYMTDLKRTAIGEYKLSDAITVEEFENILNSM